VTVSFLRKTFLKKFANLFKLSLIFSKLFTSSSIIFLFKKKKEKDKVYNEELIEQNILEV
jgi:hypothetical protein